MSINPGICGWYKSTSEKKKFLAKRTSVSQMWLTFRTWFNVLWYATLFLTDHVKVFLLLCLLVGENCLWFPIFCKDQSQTVQPWSNSTRIIHVEWKLFGWMKIFTIKKCQSHCRNSIEKDYESDQCYNTYPIPVWINEQPTWFQDRNPQRLCWSIRNLNMISTFRILPSLFFFTSNINILKQSGLQRSLPLTWYLHDSNYH